MHVTVKMPREENKERILKSSREKCDITHKANTSELPLTSQQKP
jgi:hypothetical protein